MIVKELKYKTAKILSTTVKHLLKILSDIYSDSPLTKVPVGKKEDYIKLANECSQKEYTDVKGIEDKLGFRIDTDFFNKAALHLATSKKANVLYYQHGRLIYAYLRSLIETSALKTANILEVGTARGFSAVCMAKALQDSGVNGTIHTIDILPFNKKIYWRSISDFNGKMDRKELLKDYEEIANNHIVYLQGDTKYVLPLIDIPRINFAFIDGMHTYEYVMHEYKYVSQRQEKGDVIFFDDYTQSQFPGVTKAIDEIISTGLYDSEILRFEKEFVVLKRK